LAYDAFISYSHSADGKLAPALQAALHRFAKPWWKLRAVSVFRDGTSLAAAHDLSEAIKTALAESRFFIFLAFPGAAQSKWCQREIDFWVAERPPETLLIVLTGGTIRWDEDARDFDWRATDALPRSLAGAFKAEPLWLDLSWAKSGEQISSADPRFQQGVAMLAARLHGKSLDEIAGEDVLQHRRTRRITRAAAATLAALTIASLVGAWLAVEGQRRAERNLAQALSATDTMVGEMAEGMRNFYGVPRDRLAALLGRVEGILDTLAAMESSDAIIERRAAMMRSLVRAKIDLGDLAPAAELRDKAEALIAPLAGKAGPLSGAAHTLADLQADAFDLARRRNDYAQAQQRSARYRAAVEAMLTALKPDTQQAIRSRVLQDRILAVEQERIIAMDQGRLDDALARARDGVAAAEAFLAAFPDEPATRRLPAIGRARVAQVLDDLGKPNEALAELDSVRAALIEVDRNQPNRLDILRPLIEIETARAHIFENRDEWIEAVVAHEICVIALTKLSNADPKNATLMADLAGQRTELAAAAHRLGDTARARTEFAAAAELHEAALRIVPDDVGIARSATRALQLEASFLETMKDVERARERLDRAVDLADTLTSQHGADDAGVLIGIAVRVQRARLANGQSQLKRAIADLDRAELLLGDLGRPAAPADLFRAVDIVVDMAVQWGAAAKLDRSLALIDAALGLYAPPQGVNREATVRYRVAVAKLLQQKATVQLDRSETAAAIATAQAGVDVFEHEVVPYSRRDTVLDAFGRQLVELGRIAAAAGDMTRARGAYCDVAPKLVRLAGDLKPRPRLRQLALESEYICLEARYFSGERDGVEQSLAALAERVDAVVPWDDGLQADWRSLRGRVAALRAGIRVIADDVAGAIPLLRAALEVVEDAAKRPVARSEDASRLAFLRGQLADMLERSSDHAGAVAQAEAAIAAWRQAAQLDRTEHRIEINLAEAMLTLAELVGDADADWVLKLDLEAAGLLDKLSRGVPPPGRARVLVPWSRALYRAGDAALDLGRVDESLPLHRKSLSIANELAKATPTDIAVQLDLGRQYARLARALQKAKEFAEAREQCKQARLVFTTHRAVAQDPAAVDRLIAFVDRLLADITEGEGGAQAVSKEQPG
jgi:tetratricopeptide (TPR) repeat protein